MVTVYDSIFMRSIRRAPVERAPVWLMRQAGRYLPEYRKTRERAGDFMRLCQTPQLACEVTLQPIERFGLDAAILFSDILTIPDAMGLGLSFVEGEGPVFARPIRDIAAIDALSVPKPSEDLAYVMDAIKLIRKSLPEGLPLIGFAGSPWTLACYMLEGQSSKDFKRALLWMYNQPEAVHQLLAILTEAVTLYLLEQIKSGVNAVMVFDTWGGLLTSSHYQSFSLYYMKSIVNKVKQEYPEIPVILFTKGGGQWLMEIAATGCDVVGLDWTTDLSHARASIGYQVALQGNLDPTVLLSSPECIRNEVKRILHAYGSGSGLIFNLGHGITPEVPPHHVQALVDAVKEISPLYTCLS